MRRGSYKVQEGLVEDGSWGERPPRHPDSSYSSFLLSVLIFLALCLVIMLAAWPWSKSTDSDSLALGVVSDGHTTAASPEGEVAIATEDSDGVYDKETSTTAVTEETTKRQHTTEGTALHDEGHTGGWENETELIGETVESGSHESLRGEPSTTTSESPRGDMTTDSSTGTTASYISSEHCWTPACKSDASRMLALMNHSADPCLDLYAFACGGMRAEGGQWIAEDQMDLKPKLRIGEMLQRIDSSMPLSLQKFRGFFDSCNNYEKFVDMQTRLEKAANIIKGIGKFYFDDSEVGKSTDLLGNLLLHNFSPILDIQLEIDPDDTSKFVLKLTPPEIKSPFGYSIGEDVTLRELNSAACLKKATANPRNGKEDDDFNARYKDYTKCNNNLTKYAEEVGVALQNLKLFGEVNEDKATHFIRDTVSTVQWELVAKMQEKLPSQAEKNTAMLEKRYTTFTMVDLQNKFTRVDWKSLISKLIDGIEEEDIIVQVYFESYFESIFNHLDMMNERKQINGLMAMFAHEVYYGLVLDRDACSREEYCLAVASDLMPEAASALFLRSFHSDQLSAFELQINIISEQLKSQLESEINAVAWMKGNSKDEALNKVSNMKVIADGGTTLFLDDTYLDKQFEEYHLNSTYLENAVLLMQRLRKKMYLSYEKNPLDQIWSHFVSAHSVKGKAIYGLNAVVIPYGVMLQPYIRQDSSKFLQMATLGNLIAREMWHHFDKTGLDFMGDGKREELLRQFAMRTMRSVENCLEEQYTDKKSIMMDDGINIHFQLVAPVFTNSRLADIGGSHLAFTAMQVNGSGIPLPWLSMSSKQLFFLALAQSMCTRATAYQFAVSMFSDEDLPPFLRVLDIARNSVDFAEAFSCSTEKPPSGNITCGPFTLAEEAKATELNLSEA